MGKRALAIAAHPDDAEFLCAGTLALLHQQGWEIFIATMTAGDCGSMVLDREEISRIRKAEGAGMNASGLRISLFSMTSPPF
jgi:LmbE family N-acetylglucosaminyl deacetylase